MKRLYSALLLVFIFFGCSAQTNVYHPFPTSTDSATWSVFEYSQLQFGTGCYAYHYGYYGDTIIGTKLYSKLYGNNLTHNTNDSSFNYPTSQYVCGVREDSIKKVWIRRPSDTAEVLYMDFGLTIGDSFSFTASYGPRLRLDTIDSIIVYGNYRKQFTFSLNFFNEKWIEGIGSESGWFRFPYIATMWFLLECYSENDTIKYGSTGNCHCNTYVGINELKNSFSFSLFPNPSSGIFTISSSEKLNSIEIFDVLGKEIMQQEAGSRKQEINISNFTPGIYFIKVFSESGIFSIQKMIKL